MNCKSFFFCVFLLFLFGSISVAVSAEIILPAGTLGKAELSKLVFGKTIIAENVKKGTREIYFSPQNKVQQIKHNGTFEIGQWKIKDNRLCVTVAGDRDCRIVVKSNDTYSTYVVKKNNNHKFEESFISISGGNRITGKLENLLQQGIPLPEGALNADEVLNLFNDRTVESVTAVKKRKSLSYYDPAGIVRQVRNGKTRHGKWRVKEHGRICLKMEGFPEKCRIIVKENGDYKKYIVKKNGRHVHSVSYPKFEKGNPYNL